RFRPGGQGDRGGRHREGRQRLSVQALHRPPVERCVGRIVVGGMMLKEAEIRTFVEGATHYFETSAQQSASVGSPYLVTDGNPGAYEYTGVIGISGARKGIVYFTAPRGMLTVLLMRMQETDTSDENIKDLVGEVANTISGNARRDFGKNFQISVPVVIAHDLEKVTAPHPRSYVIPINWRTHSAKLVVCLE